MEENRRDLDYARKVVADADWNAIEPVFAFSGKRVYAHPSIPFRVFVTVNNIDQNGTATAVRDVYMGAQTWATFCAAGYGAAQRAVGRLLAVGGSGFVSWEDEAFHKGAQALGLLSADPLHRLRQDAEALIAGIGEHGFLPHMMLEYTRIREAVDYINNELGRVRSLLHLAENAVADGCVVDTETVVSS